MIVLLGYSTNLYCSSSTGVGIDSVVVAVDAIRKANIKLIEGQAAIKVNIHLKEIISKQEEQIDILTNTIKLRNASIVNLTHEVSDVKRKYKKAKLQRNRAIVCSSGLGTVLLLLLIL